MTDIVLFKPREQLSAEQQVSEFIAMAKRITAFDYKADGSYYPLKWDNVNWGDWLGIGFVKFGVHSSRLRPAATVPLLPEEIMDVELIDFAKAYCLYGQAIKRTKTVKEIEALRAIEHALVLLRGKADITLVDEAVLDEAAGFLKKNYSPGGANRSGNHLAKLGTFLTDMRLVPKPIMWKNTIPRPLGSDIAHRTRKEAAEKKLPNPKALDAVAEIFANKPTATRDILTTSMCAMSMCAPSRAGELVEAIKAPFDEKKTRDGKPELFVKWFSEKGFGRNNKPIPETMAPIYKEAVRRVADITEDARELAKFLEENPDKFPMHDGCPDVGQDAVLLPEQVCESLQLAYPGAGYAARTKLKSWLKYNIEVIRRSRSQDKYPKTFAILNEALAGLADLGRRKPKGVTKSEFYHANDTYTLTLRKLNIILREYWLPPHFPYVSDKRITKYSEALFCFFENDLSEDPAYKTRRYSLQVIDSNTLTTDLFSGKKANYQSLFERWGYEGAEYKINTHQFRHWLNTLAQKGNVGQVEVARWSGRLDISQNRVYNHRSPEDEVAGMKRVGLGAQPSSLAQLSRTNEPVLISDIGGSGRGDRIAHVTIYGFCEHDFAMEPCQKYRGCITCKKHKCVKGNEEKLRRLKFERDQMKPQLDKAANAAAEGFYGADRWLDDYMKKFERYEQLIAVLEDPAVEEGAVIQLTDDGFSPLKQAIEMRGETEVPSEPMLEPPRLNPSKI